MNMERNNTNTTKADENQEAASAKTACGGKLKDPTNFPNAIYRDLLLHTGLSARFRAGP